MNFALTQVVVTNIINCSIVADMGPEDKMTDAMKNRLEQLLQVNEPVLVRIEEELVDLSLKVELPEVRKILMTEGLL